MATQTPLFFINHIPPPGDLKGYDRNRPAAEQPSSIPRDFSEAMEVRKEVFVTEQNVPLEFELDNDDTRSWHWVAYSTSDKKPIGTIRLVPSPHSPHPEPWAKYMGQEEDGTPIIIGFETPTGENGASNTTKPTELQRETGRDRATALHDGVEPYVKLGRMAVVKEFRGKAVARALIQAALDWVSQNMASLDNSDNSEKYNGLVCVHAQTQVVGLWSKAGFQIDDQMGTWWEEGIPHYGMFCRITGKS